MVSTTRVMTTGLPSRLHLLMTLFCTRAIFSGATSSPRFPRLRTIPSAAIAMPGKLYRAARFSTCKGTWECDFGLSPHDLQRSLLLHSIADLVTTSSGHYLTSKSWDDVYSVFNDFFGGSSTTAVTTPISIAKQVVLQQAQTGKGDYTALLCWAATLLRKSSWWS